MIDTKMIKRIIQVAWHRNGVDGGGFHAVIFTHVLHICALCGSEWGWGPIGATIKQRTCRLGQGDKKHKAAARRVKKEVRLLGIVYDTPGCVSVLDIDKLSDPAIGVAFGDFGDGNSWRGSLFEGELRAAIKAHSSDGSTRIGPFAIPTKRRRP
jgi:hypothetical protein